MAAHRGWTGNNDLASSVEISTPIEGGEYTKIYIKFSQQANPSATDTIATVIPAPVDLALFAEFPPPTAAVPSSFPFLDDGADLPGSKSGVTTIL
mmetsp:Transcript_13978/g.29897  ORF Transcript_13978/g.29897 Transcript_13978/m.29897 type:complete len:95 (+) Transcript_13978:432-716(+)